MLEPFKPYLNTRFTVTEGQVSGSRLFLELRGRGYRGSRRVVRKHLAALRSGTAEPVRADIPSPRKITSWIMRPRESLTDSQDKRLLEARRACPHMRPRPSQPYGERRGPRLWRGRLVVEGVWGACARDQSFRQILWDERPDASRSFRLRWKGEQGPAS